MDFTDVVAETSVVRRFEGPVGAGPGARGYQVRSGGVLIEGFPWAA